VSNAADGEAFDPGKAVVLGDDRDVVRHCGGCDPRAVHWHSLAGFPQQHPEACPLGGNSVIDREWIQPKCGRQRPEPTISRLDRVCDQHAGAQFPDRDDRHGEFVG